MAVRCSTPVRKHPPQGRRLPYLFLVLLGALKLPGCFPTFAVVSPSIRSRTEKFNDLAEKGNVVGTLEEFRKLLPQALPSQKTMMFNTAIKACSNAGDLDQAEALFSEMLELRVQQNEKGFGKMIEAAAKQGNLSAAELWFRRLSRRFNTKVIAHNQMILAAGKAGDLEAAENWFEEILRKNMRPSGGTLAALLEACAVAGDVAKARSFMAKWRSLGLEIDYEHENALRKVYAKSNDLETLEEQLRKLEKPVLKDYGVVMDAAARCGNLTAAEFWFHEAQAAGQRMRQDVIYVTMMFAAAKAADLAKCEEWFQRSAEARLQPSGRMYTALVTSAAESLDVEAADHWLRLCRAELGPDGTPAEAINAAMRAAGLRGDVQRAAMWAEMLSDHGMELDGYSYRALLTAAARASDTVQAKKWFGRAVEQREVGRTTCNAAIQAAAIAGDTNLAREMLQQMKAVDVQPDEVTYRAAITSASNARDMSAAEAFISEAKIDGLDQADIYAPIISLAAKTRGLQAAEDWFRKAQSSRVAVDIFSYNAVIGAASKAGNLNKAQRWLEEALQAAEEPDLITYTNLISAAAKKGNLQVALGYMKAAVEKGLQPDIQMMNSVIFAAAKAGDLATAQQVYQQAVDTGLKPTTRTFAALITAALAANDLELAESWLQKCKDAGLKPGVAVMQPFITFATQQRDLKLAESWFDRMVTESIDPDMKIYGSLISAANKAREGYVADAWLIRGIQNGVRLDKNCFGIAITAMASFGAYQHAMQRLDDMVQYGFPAEMRQINGILKAISQKAESGAARQAAAEQILERMAAWRVQSDHMSDIYFRRCLGRRP